MSLHRETLSTVHAAGPRPHGELVDDLLDHAGPLDGRPDLVILTYDEADTQGALTVASHLNHRTGGAAHSFGLTGVGPDGGAAAATIAEAYHRAGRSDYALVAVIDGGSGVLLRLSAGSAAAIESSTRSRP
jgi:hypothetical protein